MAIFNLMTFGGLDLQTADGESVHLSSKKAGALLVYLATCPGQPVSRAKIAGLLWADRGDEQARGSLRQTLSVLRKALNDADGEILVASGEGVKIVGERLHSDVAAFDAALASGHRQDLERAAILYRGPFLDGFDIRTDPYEEWLSGERMRLAESAANAMFRIAAYSESDGDLDAALAANAKLLTIDPLREDAHRSVMRLHQQAGRFTDALRQYRICQSMLESELGIEPQEETRRLHEEVLAYRKSASPGPADRDRKTAPDTSVGRRQQEAGKSSIAVLPFENMSGDPEQEYFADGMTEDIITELSRFRDLFVIARNSTFVYKGRAVDTRTVAEELGIRYVLEGSIRRNADRIRVSAQLIDARSRDHLWAERYDRELSDIFAVQDEITQTIVSALEPELDSAERRRAASANAGRLNAWGAYHRGMWHIYRFTKEDTRQALDLFEQAIQLEPSFAAGWSGKSFAHFSNVFLGYVDDRLAERRLALQAARRSVELDDRDATAHWSLARAYMLDADYDSAIPEFERAIALNPNFAQAYYQALYLMRDFEQALEWAEKARRQSHAHAHIEAVRIACLVRTNQVDAGKSAMKLFLTENPHFTQSFFLETHGFTRPQDGKLYTDALAKAGMPKD
jgi:TolB-like protein/DNA-binding winged helix-turn-helix (wHTH) protein/Tfp pilus assembly protein PilF